MPDPTPYEKPDVELVDTEGEPVSTAPIISAD